MSKQKTETNNARLDLIRGTLDVLILKALTWGPAHGLAIARRIRNESDGVLLVEEGALYPALHRVERKGWLDAEWGLSETKRRAKYYRLTGAGRAELLRRATDWDRYATAVNRMLAAAP